MRRAVALGLMLMSEADLPFLGEIPRTEADIRAGIGRLENPLQRITDRLFWFRRQSESRIGKRRTDVNRTAPCGVMKKPSVASLRRSVPKAL